MIIKIILMELCAFTNWSDYTINDLLQVMIQSGHYSDVLNFMCTCQRIFRLGQSLLKQEYQRLVYQPPTISFSSTDETCSQEWHDLQGCLHRDGDLHAKIEFNGNVKSWYQHGQLHRNKDRPLQGGNSLVAGQRRQVSSRPETGRRCRRFGRRSSGQTEHENGINLDFYIEMGINQL